MTTARLMLAGGTGRLVRRPSVVLFDPTGQNLDLANRFDGAASDSDAVDELKKHLIESGFTAAPLVLAEWSRGEFDLLVFGDVQVHTSAIAAPMVSGVGSSTWVERHLGSIELGAATTVEIWSGTAADPTTNLGLGVVACAGFRMSLDFADLDGLGGAGAGSPKVVALAEPAAAVVPDGAASPGVGSPDSAPVVEAETPAPLAPVAEFADWTETEDVDDPSPAEDAIQPEVAGQRDGEPADPFTADPFIADPVTTSASAPASGLATAAAVSSPSPDLFGAPEGTGPNFSPEPRAGLIEAAHCSLGHPNPPRSANCYVCGDSLAQDQLLELIEQPSVGRIVFVGGQELPLGRAVMMGRKPDAAPVGAHPVLIDHVEVSRSHALVSIEGWTVLLTDQGSRNGTWVVPANDPTPVRLNSQVPHVLEHGTTVHLGAPEVSFVYYFDA